MKKQLIFSQSVSGHYLEYIHHLYMGAIPLSDVEVIFVVPQYFSEQKKLLEWPPCDHISWELVPDEKLPWGSWLVRSYHYSRVLRDAIKKYKPDSLFLLNIMLAMPLLPFLACGKVKISGIIYGIYLYRWNDLSLIRKIAEVFWHLLLVRGPRMDRLYILNDRTAARYCNRLYHTGHFRFLPDPYMPCQIEEQDFRKNYEIPKCKKVFLHFGSFGLKKGTLLILETIISLSEEEAADNVFVFAGQVQDIIKPKFNELLAKARLRTTVMVFDGFCSYDVLANWCRACDAILIPYLLTYNSSGCIGYAAQFRKPVIATDSGLLGKLVRRYHLGIALKATTPTGLRQAFSEVDNWQSDGDSYLYDNNPDSFSKTIYSNI